MTLGTFAAHPVDAPRRQLGRDDRRSRRPRADQSRRWRFSSATMMFSLAGIPPLAGFFAKFYVFAAAIKAGSMASPSSACCSSAVGAYYYLRIVKIMYFDEPAKAFDRPGAGARIVLALVEPLLVIFFALAPVAADRRGDGRGAIAVLSAADRAPARATSSPADGAVERSAASTRPTTRRGVAPSPAIPAALWIIADEQSAGRGRQGRVWASPPGNLYASALLVDPCPVGVARAARLRRGRRAAARGGRNLGVAGVALKWPNDLVVDGAKLRRAAGRRRNAARTALCLRRRLRRQLRVRARRASAIRRRTDRAPAVAIDPARCSGGWSSASTRRSRSGGAARAFRDPRAGLARSAARLGERHSRRERAGDGAKGLSKGLTCDGRLLFRGASGSRRIEAADLWILPHRMARPCGVVRFPAREGRRLDDRRQRIRVRAARRPRRNRHELRALRLRAGQGAQMADGRPRPRLRRRGAAGRRSHHAGPRLHREGRRRTSSASSSPTPTRTISARWPNSGRASACTVYTTRFAAGLAEARRLGEPGAPKIPIEIVSAGRRASTIGPFDVEFVAVAHSIPESSRAGDPHAGRPRRPHRRLEDRPDAAASARRPTRRGCAALGDEGVLALVCDSTNVLREGESPSEADVAATLRRSSARRRAACVVTTFASNVARLRAAAEAGLANGRQVIVIGPRDGAGRSRWRANAAISTACRRSSAPIRSSGCRATRCWRSRPAARASRAPRWRASPRTSIRMRRSAPGDTVIFSSRTIPGNEKAVGKVINGLVAPGRRSHHRPHASRACLRPSAPRRTGQNVCLAEAANRRSRARRGGASDRTCGLREGAGRRRGRARVQRRHRAISRRARPA